MLASFLVLSAAICRVWILGRQIPIRADAVVQKKVTFFSALASHCATILKSTRRLGGKTRRRHEFPLSQTLQSLECRHLLSGVSTSAFPIAGHDKFATTSPETVDAEEFRETIEVDSNAALVAANDGNPTSLQIDIPLSFQLYADFIQSKLLDGMAAEPTREWPSIADQIDQPGKSPFGDDSLDSQSTTDRTTGDQAFTDIQREDLDSIITPDSSSEDHELTDSLFALLATAGHADVLGGNSKATVTSVSSVIDSSREDEVTQADQYSASQQHSLSRHDDWHPDSSLRSSDGKNQTNSIFVISIFSDEASFVHVDPVDGIPQHVTEDVTNRDGGASVDRIDGSDGHQNGPNARSELNCVYGHANMAFPIDELLLSPGFRFDHPQPHVDIRKTEFQAVSPDTSWHRAGKSPAETGRDRRFQLRPQKLQTTAVPDLSPRVAELTAIAAFCAGGVSFCLYRVAARGPPRGPPRSERLCSDRRFRRLTSHLLSRLKFSISPRGPSLDVRSSVPVIFSISGPGRTFRASSLC